MHLFEVGEEIRQREIDRLNQVKARATATRSALRSRRAPGRPGSTHKT